MARHVAAVGRAGDDDPRPRAAGRIEARRRGLAGGQFLREGDEDARLAEVEPGRIAARLAEQPGRPGDRGIGHFGEGGVLRDRVGDDRLHRHALVHEAVDERCVGAVLEQPPDKVGEQLAVLADGRVGAHRRHVRHLALRLVEQQLAHAMQPLELELDAGRAHREHCADRVRVVRGELRVDRRRRRQQPPGAG